MQVRIGRMRENSNLSAHLSIAGVTCNRTRPVLVDAKTVNADARRCKSCFTPARIALARQLVFDALASLRAAARNAYDAKADRALTVLAEMLAPADEVARIAALTARLLGTQFARDCGVAPAPVERPTLATVLAGFGTTQNAPHYAKAARRRDRKNSAPIAA